jgi:membrane protease YdiL (CAAX protease family)
MLTDKPWKLADFLGVMALLIALLTMGIASNLMATASPGDTAPVPGRIVNFVIALCLYGTIFAIVHLMVQNRGTSWRAAFGFKSPRQVSALLMALGVTLIAFPITYCLGILSSEFMTHVHLTPVPQQSVQLLQETVSIEPQIYLAVMAIVVAPITEELLFRGVLYPFVKQHGYPRLALWGTAILFGVLHLNLMTFLPLTFLGLLLAWLYDMTDNLAAPIFAHSLFNLVNFLWALVARQA